MKRNRTRSPESSIVAGLVKTLRDRRGARREVEPVAYTLEASSLAVVAASLSLRMDQEPSVLLADAQGLLNDAKEFLAEYAPGFDADEEREMASHLSLTLSFGRNAFNGVFELSGPAL